MYVFSQANNKHSHTEGGEREGINGAATQIISGQPDTLVNMFQVNFQGLKEEIYSRYFRCIKDKQ